MTLRSPKGHPMRREPDHFGDVDLPLLYIARKLDEALKLEALLTDAGLDYLVEPDKYSGGIVFRSERIGAFFYVAPEDDGAARLALQKAGYKPYDASNEK
ncbi:MAG: hypothetical protein ABI824_05330 [Acidobacteriota bacterium]